MLGRELRKAARLDRLEAPFRDAIVKSYARRLREALDQFIAKPETLSARTVLPVDWTSAGAAAELFVKALLMGMDHALPPDSAFADSFPVEVLPFDEAVRYMRGRLPMSRDEYYALDDKMRFRAFTVSRLADADAVERVQGFLVKGLEEGSTLADFRRMTNDELLDAAGLGKTSGWYWETVYRTNQQTAYNVGRAMGYAAVPPLALELVGVEDSRQTDICRNLTVPPFRRPYGDPVWQTLWPPFHFNCRTFPRAIYDQSELDAAGDASYSPDVPDAPEAGWGSYPLDGSSWWEPTDGMMDRAAKAGIAPEIEEARGALIKMIGADSGGLKDRPEGDQDAHAEKYYRAIRNRKGATDIRKIAEHTGISEADIAAVRNHLFMAEHDLGEGARSRFAADYKIALAWQRMEEGKGILASDLVLLRHELEELTLMAKYGYDYPKAHELANKKYSWGVLVKDQ